MLAEEMERYPLARTKDGIDALAYIPSLAFAAGVEKKPEPSIETHEGLLKRFKIGPYAQKAHRRLKG